MSSKIYITQGAAQAERDKTFNAELEYRLRMELFTAAVAYDAAIDADIRKDAKKNMKAICRVAELMFGGGAGTYFRTEARTMPVSPKAREASNAYAMERRQAHSAMDGGQAPKMEPGQGTLHSASATVYPYGAKAGTSADGAGAGTLPMKRKQAPWPRGPKAGTSAYTYGREAGVFVEHLPYDVAEGWRTGRADGAGAGTPLQQASNHFHKKAEEEARYVGWGGGVLEDPKPSSDGRWAGTSSVHGHDAVKEPRQGTSPMDHTPALDINWTPFDDFAVGGTFDEDKRQGRMIAKLIAKKRGQR